MWEEPDETTPKLKPDTLTHNRIQESSSRQSVAQLNSLKHDGDSE